MVGANFTDSPADVGDPSLGLGIPFEQYRSSYDFLTPESYTKSYVNIFAPAGATFSQTSTLTIDGSSARVSVQSGLNGNVVSVFGPIKLDTEFGITLTPLVSSPLTLNFDARGMLTPTPVANLKYKLSIASSSDTLCISPAGIIMPKGCQL